MNKLKTLTSVVRLKQHKQEELEAEVRQLRLLISHAEERLLFLEKTFTETGTTYEEKQEKPNANIHEMELYTNYISQLDADMTVQRKLISKSLKELTHLQNSLLALYKDKKLFETLAGRIAKEDLRLREQADQKEMDFLFLSGKKRNR